MQAKTRALVLGTLKYGETSMIVQAYTEVFGWQSYLVQGVRSPKAKGGKVALYQALNFLELDIQYAPTRELQRIVDAKIALPYHSIPFNMKKATVGLFLAEMLGKVLRESDGEESIFEYLIEAFSQFDAAEQQYENFHLQLLIGLSYCMGFGLDWEELSEIFGVPLPEEALGALQGIQASVYVPLSGKSRSILLDLLIHFYRHHLGGSWELKSLPVLQEVWGGA